MAPNWSRLAPHRPLTPGDPLHVRRPQGGGDELSARLLKGGVDVVAVVGPVGSGKSTELAQAASLLQDQFVVVQVLLDRVLDMRRATEEDVFLHVALRIGEIARTDLGIELSPALKDNLYPLGGGFMVNGQPHRSAMPARDLLLSVMREVAGQSAQGALALFLDGLEKCDATAALPIVGALLDVRDEARLVFVAPYSLVVGSGGHALHASGTYFHLVRAVPVRRNQGSESEDGRRFLREIARVRLDLPSLPPDLELVFDRAAELSGGLPRSFLQLVRAAGSYAALEERDGLMLADLDAAARDQAESLGRLLEKGDVEQLRNADGKSEREIPRDDRLRLLMNGLLLEYKTREGTVVHPAPLLQGLLTRPGPP